jgi:lipopolysaccharide/colanic/teichoic acid biosynthesis glycosyltransferase
MLSPSWRAQATKRLLDVIGGATALLITAPLVACAAAFILVMDGRPILYTQWRVGRGGRLFRIYKLRTMRRDAERWGGVKFAGGGDSRVIRRCRWIRCSHVDELPQLWNILKGDMSLVGPRPERPEIISDLRRLLERFEDRLLMKPGLTGLAQVRAGYANTTAALRRKLRYDLLYIRRWSWAFDLKLILLTLLCIWDSHAG